MFNKEKLYHVIDQYKKDFMPKLWVEYGENFKWKAVKHFQDNWDIEAEDFEAMLKRSLEKTYNLLGAMNYFPRRMIKKYAEKDPENVRKMFKNLFDESLNLENRLENFQASAEMMKMEHVEFQEWNHYQNLNSISTYLWLRYPDNYYIYKYSEYRALAKELESDFMPKRGASFVNIQGGYELYDEIRKYLLADKDLMQILEDAVGDEEYPDKKAITLMIDLGHYIKSYYKKSLEDGEQELLIKETHQEASALDDSKDEVSKRYWWLNANPKIWSFSNIKIGETQSYTLLNENGNKRRIFQNFLDAKVGDLVIAYESQPTKKIVSIAKIAKEQDGEKLYFEKIENLSEPINFSVFKDAVELADMEYLQNFQGSLFKLTKEEFDFIMDLIREHNPVKITVNEEYTREDFLNDVFMEPEQYETLVSLLKNKNNLIIQGPPGVGKTYSAKRLAYSIMGEKDEDKLEFIQFHQNYAYEDFVMGYKPKDDGFELQEGIFYKFCRKAESQPDKSFFFIIDEINRGNMSKIFGELLLLIEKDYRGTAATLAYNGLDFSVPENIYIIGMMNTADRSLALIDYALRRRFGMFKMEPGFDTDGFVKYQKTFDNENFNALTDLVKELNVEIANDSSLGKGFLIGHSYFSNWESCDEERMKEVIRYEILPTLEEYWFDNESLYEQWEKRFEDVIDD